MSGIAITITDRGRAALVAARGTNPVTIAEVGVTAANFTASPDALVLPGEIKRLTTFSGEASDAYTVHITIRDDSIDAYELRGFALYLSDGTLFGIYGNAPALIMEKAGASMLLLAIDITFTASDTKQIAFGNTNFLNPPATTERDGVVELATEGEATTGTDTTRAVTPKAMLSAVTNWINTRFGNGAPSDFVKGILTAINAAAMRAALGIKSAALKDEGDGKGLDADLLDGQEGSYYANVPARLGYTPLNKAGDTINDHLTVSSGDRVTLTGSAIQFSRGSANFLWATTADGYLCFGGGGRASSAANAHFYTHSADLGVTFNGGANFAGTVGVEGTLNASGLALGSGNQFIYDAGSGSVGIRAGMGTSNAYLSFSPSGLLAINGSVIWHAGNDGAGSGLDADLFDGRESSYFTNIVERLGYIPVNKSGDAMLGPLNVGGMVTAHSYAFGSGNQFLYDVGSGAVGLRAGTGGTNAYLSFYPSGLFTVGGNQIWHAGNDGAGSGLDADLFHGLGTGSFVRTDLPSTLALGANLYINGNTSFGLIDGSGFFDTVESGVDAAPLGLVNYRGSGVRVGPGTNGSKPLYAGALYDSGNRVWHAGNDGSGSALDADTLDGRHLSEFVPTASSWMPNATTHPEATTPWSGDYTRTISSGKALVMFNGVWQTGQGPFYAQLYVDGAAIPAAWTSIGALSSADAVVCPATISIVVTGLSVDFHTFAVKYTASADLTISGGTLTVVQAA
jgi:hypothetical protein